MVDTPAPFARVQARLTAAEPDAGLTPMTFLQAPTVQIEGEFGEGAVTCSLSNSGLDAVPWVTVRASEIAQVPPAVYFGAAVEDADAGTAVVVTLAGRR